MTATLSACQWNWCTRTFEDHSALKEHVELDHIAKATPVKRKDVPFLKLIETGASLPESYLTNFLVSATDSSSQSPSFPSPTYVQCGVMTDPTEFSMPGVSHSSDIPGSSQNEASPVPSPRPFVQDNQLLSKFAEMRGTPSPTPSPFPPSPGTAYLVKKMTQHTPYPVYSQCTPNASPHTPRNHQNTSLDQPVSTPNGRDSNSCSTFSNLAQTDHTVPRHTNATTGAEAFPSSQDVVESQLTSMGDVDSPHHVDIDPVLLPGLDPQWQPQSQLSFPEGFEYSSPPSTVNPSQLHIENMEEI